MDRAAVEAILGKGMVWTEEDALDVTYLMDKSICEGLTMEEQEKLDALIALYVSGR
jgi:hypothetical protein